jgi:hypothetical protein
MNVEISNFAEKMSAATAGSAVQSAAGDLALRTLRRQDPSIEAILHSTKHTALYAFADDKWVRFLVQQRQR